MHQAPEGRELEFDGLTSATNSQLMDVMKEVAKTGICLAAHAEDNELITGNIAKLRAEGRTDYIAHLLNPDLRLPKSKQLLKCFDLVKKLVALSN